MSQPSPLALLTKKITNKTTQRKSGSQPVLENFIYSESENGLIFAPTQVGKSAATAAFIKTCINNNVPCIVSTDNKTDQQEQLYSRIEDDLIGTSVVFLKASDRTFAKDLQTEIKNKSWRFVIFTLDNASQVEKVIVQLTSNYIRNPQMKNIQKIAIIHDEADTITKDTEIDIQNPTQPESHKRWLELREVIKKRMGSIQLKRVFVTATPENCCMLYQIENAFVMNLEIPAFYTGYRDIQHHDIKDDLDFKVLIKREVKRIKREKTAEAILYCLDKKVSDHAKVMRTLANATDTTVCTYNGLGISVIVPEIFIEKLENILQNESVSYKSSKSLFIIKDMAIRQFYTIVKEIGENCVITIGKDLITRGISYVSRDQVEPITATTLFYKPGNTMHAVGICQTIGRITGCAMPGLQRKVYTTADVFDTYLSYNKNQEKYISKITNSDTKQQITKDVIEDLVFSYYKRNVDRKKLDLKMNTKPKRKENVENKMKKLLKLWNGKETIIGKVLGYVYANKIGRTKNEIMRYLQEIGSDNPTSQYQELVKSDRSHNTVFQRNTEQVTNLTPQARRYLATL